MHMNINTVFIHLFFSFLKRKEQEFTQRFANLLTVN